jgi:hypothetical protein
MVRQHIVVRSVGKTRIEFQPMHGATKAVRLIKRMTWGSYKDGVRTMPSRYAEQAFTLIDAANLNTLTLG